MRFAAIALALVTAVSACVGAAGTLQSGAPWSASQTVTPGALAKELQAATGDTKPLVVFTGPAMLYRVGHVPGAVAHGPASSPEGLADLKAWARTVTPTRPVVLYCGCCPLDACPNLRPSFAALREMGFTRVRVLLLPTNFHTDWTSAGLPVEK
jgi:thiosulfate/3-mercaptopyruvate sulfurtransferase